jgi:flagellar biosynthesis protein FlhB
MEKTHAPSAKRLEDAARKGQLPRLTDLLHLVSLCAIGAFVFSGAGFGPVLDMLRTTLVLPETDVIKAAAQACRTFFTYIAAVIGVALVVTVLPSLIVTRFRLSPEAMRLNFAKLNPIEGFKRLFTIKSLKDLLKSLLYLGAFCLAVNLYFGQDLQGLFRLNRVPATQLGPAALKMLIELVGLCMLMSLAIVAAEGFIEILLHYRDLRMSREEVKQESKNMEGDPEVKSRRKELSHELLSDEHKANIRESSFMLANPTHIAIGIFLHPRYGGMPLVSVRETDQVARAALRYAESVGVPVVRDVRLARGLYRDCKRYDLVPAQWLAPLVEVLAWLASVETARLRAFGQDGGESYGEKADPDSADRPADSDSQHTISETAPDTSPGDATANGASGP